MNDTSCKLALNFTYPDSVVVSIQGNILHQLLPELQNLMLGCPNFGNQLAQVHPLALPISPQGSCQITCKDYRELNESTSSFDKYQVIGSMVEYEGKLNPMVQQIVFKVAYDLIGEIAEEEFFGKFKDCTTPLYYNTDHSCSPKFYEEPSEEIQEEYMSQNCMNGGDASLLESKDSFDFSKILSISKTPINKLIAAGKKSPRPKGRKSKSTKTKEEIEAGTQSTIVEKFANLRRSTRRTKRSSRLQ